jgi:hypothetical protein
MPDAGMLTGEPEIAESGSMTAASSVVRRPRARRARWLAAITLAAVAAGALAWLAVQPPDEAPPESTRSAEALIEARVEPPPGAPAEPPLEPEPPVEPAPEAQTEESIEPTAAVEDSPRPRTRRAARRARTRATGRVMIATPGGWAYVYRGSRRLGQTPLTTELPVGRHVLELRPFGRPPYIRRTVRITESDPAQLVVRLE